MLQKMLRSIFAAYPNARRASGGARPSVLSDNFWSS
jgi:hypothetical protein